MRNIFKAIVLDLLFAAIFFGGVKLPAQGNDLIFENLSIEQGLSNNDVKTVIQDKTGFIWFGTDDGLNRYDGYNFKIFRHDPEDSNSISDNSIWALMPDSKGNVWIGTKEGMLNKYDPASEKFTHWKIKSALTEENSVVSIYEDPKGNIWIGSYQEGLYRLNLSTNKVDHWNTVPDDSNSLSNKYVLSIIEDNTGNIVVGTYRGLSIFNPDLPKKKFKRFYFDPLYQNSLSSNLIWNLSKSVIDSNIIWICTANGLTKFNTKNSRFERVEIYNPGNLQYGTSISSVINEIVGGENIIWAASYAGLLRINVTLGMTDRFVHDENSLRSIVNDQINKIIKDRSGVIWIATENGVSYSTPKSTLFNSLNTGEFDFNIAVPLRRKNITAIFRSSDERIWVGTENGLYSIVNVNDNPQLRRIETFEGYHIWSLTSTNDNEIWIGTFGKGLIKFNFKENKKTVWEFNNPKIRNGPVNYCKTLLTDSKNNVWVGYWGFGVARINPVTGKYHTWIKEPGNPKSISHNDVWVIKEDRFGRIWIGTLGGGLNLYEDKENGIYHHWLRAGDKKNNLSSNNIFSICESGFRKHPQDENITVLWIGTLEGLNKVVVKNKKGSDNIYDFDVEIESYSVKDGLRDNSVYSILEDNDGNLWLGTGTGISFFDVSKKTFTNFSSADGISGMMMNDESALKLDNGLMLFGSKKGLNVFDYQKIKLSSYKPAVVITDFKLFNESVVIGENSPLKESILVADEIILSHDQNVFSFEFASLDYNSTKSIQYAYKMEGYDKEWIKSGTRRFVTYTNLDAGTYSFNVKATNADGVWNETRTSINIIIKPPFYQTWIAYCLYVIICTTGMYSFRKYELRKRKEKNELLLKEEKEKSKLMEAQLRVEKAELQAKAIESEQELEKQKIRSRIASDLHDEIGSNLSSITLLSSLMKDNINHTPEVKKQLSDINFAAKTSAESIRDIIWFINPVSDKLGSLLARIKETANMMLAGVSYKINIDKVNPEVNISPELKRNIYFVFKEALNNIIKHSSAQNVLIQISKEGRALHIIIHDDGSGFNTDDVKAGNGLRNIRSRAGQLNGELAIDSSRGGGTKINLKVNIT